MRCDDLVSATGFVNIESMLESLVAKILHASITTHQHVLAIRHNVLIIHQYNSNSLTT